MPQAKSSPQGRTPYSLYQANSSLLSYSILLYFSANTASTTTALYTAMLNRCAQLSLIAPPAPALVQTQRMKGMSVDRLCATQTPCACGIWFKRVLQLWAERALDTELSVRLVWCDCGTSSQKIKAVGGEKREEESRGLTVEA